MFNVLATLAAVVAFAILMPSLFQISANASRTIKMSSAAQQMRQMETAVQGYLLQNYPVVVTNASDGTTAKITPAMLQASGFLPANFQNANAYGQVYTAEITQPSAGNLLGVVETSGGVTIPEADAAEIAAMVGQYGGYIPNGTIHNKNNAQGAFDGWEQCLGPCGYDNPGAGHLASLIYVNNGEITSPDYLYRVQVQGHPELNAMQTDLNMLGAKGPHNIVGVQEIGVGTQSPDAGLDITPPAGMDAVHIHDPDDPMQYASLRVNAARNDNLEILNSNGLPDFWDKTGDAYVAGMIAPNARNISGAQANTKCPQYGALTTNTDNKSGVLQCKNNGSGLIWMPLGSSLSVDSGSYVPGVVYKASRDLFVFFKGGSCGNCNVVLRGGPNATVPIQMGNETAGTYGDWVEGVELSAAIPSGWYFEVTADGPITKPVFTVIDMN